MTMSDALSDLAAAAGVGALASLAGTPAMTVSSTLEAKARGREPSRTPATAAGKVRGVQPTDETTKTSSTTSPTGHTAPAGEPCAACAVPLGSSRASGRNLPARAFARVRGPPSTPVPSSVAGVNEPGLVGEYDSLDPVPKPELVEDPSEMRLYGGLR